MSGPLQSLRILDFSTLLPGPFASLMLADLGADVLRIESPTRPDLVRVLPPYVRGVSVVHAHLNRNKRSLAVDLKQPAGHEIMVALLKQYDVVIEQFRPGVMARLGLSYEDLREHCPGLIYVSITGYGQTGPYRDRAGHDLNYLALSGILSYNGRKATGPQPMAVQVADVAGGSAHAVIALLAAIVHRQQTGEGQYIDISMTDAAFSLQALTAPAALAEGSNPALEGDTLNGGSFYDCYACADGLYLSVAGLEPQFFAAFVQVLGRPDLAGMAVVREPGQVAWLKAEIAQELAKLPRQDWLNQFANLDTCTEPVLSFQEACQHPVLQERGMLVDVPDRQGGSLKQVASPLRFSRTPVTYRYAGGAVGEDSDQVLKELGIAAAIIEQWRRDGVIG